MNKEAKLGRVFCLCIYENGFWFRLFGRGLSISTEPKTFTQRNGFQKCWMIGKLKIVVLPVYKVLP